MNHTQGGCQWLVRDAGWWALEFAGSDGVKAGARRIALKCDKKDGDKSEDDHGGEEGVMANEPFAGGEAGQSQVEHGDGHLDEGCSDIEGHLLHGGELGGINMSTGRVLETIERVALPN